MLRTERSRTEQHSVMSAITSKQVHTSDQRSTRKQPISTRTNRQARIVPKPLTAYLLRLVLEKCEQSIEEAIDIVKGNWLVDEAQLTPGEDFHGLIQSAPTPWHDKESIRMLGHQCLEKDCNNAGKRLHYPRRYGSMRSRRCKHSTSNKSVFALGAQKFDLYFSSQEKACYPQCRKAKEKQYVRLWRQTACQLRQSLQLRTQPDDPLHVVTVYT